MKKSKTLIIIGIVISFFIGLFGLTYGYLRTQILGNENTSSVIVQMGDIDIVFSDSQYLNDTLEDPGWTTTKSFTVTNNGSLPGTYSIYWETLINELVNKADLTYTITSTSSGGTLSQTQVPNSGYDVSIIPSVTINAGATQVYTMTINYANTSSDQSSDMGKILYGKVKITPTSYTPQLPTLADAIKMNEPVIRTVTNDTMFQSNATTDEGLWTENRTGKTEGNLPTYFFRGAVQDNYVKFGSDASGDLIWRIIRINEDGSVRMILDKSLPDDNVFQLQSVDLLKQNMYMPDNEVVSGSAADVLNTWYNTTFSTAQKAKVSTDAIYCNDMSTGRVDGYDTYFGAYTRLEASSTQFLCPQTNDKLVSTSSTLNASNVNKVLLQPIALITADEIMYAGETWGTDNTSFYLNKSYYYWSLSPYSVSSVRGSARGFFVDPGSGLDSSIDYVWLAHALVPVITLRSDILTTGTGVVGDEYIIQ